MLYVNMDLLLTLSKYVFFCTWHKTQCPKYFLTERNSEKVVNEDEKG